MRVTMSGRSFIVATILAVVLAGGSASAKTRPPPPLPATPQAFVDQLKSLYPQADTTANDPNWWQWHNRLYDPEFIRLMDENESYGPLIEGIVDVDHDPLCACQTSNGFFRVSSMSPRKDGAVEIRADHCYPADDRVKTSESCDAVDMVIKRIDGAWRLYDVLEPGSLRQRLVRHNACLHAAKTKEAADACLAT